MLGSPTAPQRGTAHGKHLASKPHQGLPTGAHPGFRLNSQTFFTIRCLADGMMWLDPQPTEDFYRRLYDEQYHTAGSEDPLLEQATLDVHSDSESLQWAATVRLDQIEKFVPRGNFLEVGFGSGHTLREARRRGWEAPTSQLTCLPQ